MKKFKHIILLPVVLITFVISNSCEKNTETKFTGTKLEIYTLKSFSTEKESLRIIDSTVIVDDTPLISYNEIISYNTSDYSFEVSESAINKLNQDGGLKYHFKPFAVTIDRSIIYTGYFWPAYSSSIVQWFVIDPILYSGDNKLKVSLAYPTDNFAGNYQDKRNDNQIIGLLTKDGKIEN